MRIAVRPIAAGAPRVPALWIGMAEGDTLESLKLPAAFRRPVRAAIAARDITGKKNQLAVVYADSGRLLLSGLGARKEINADVLREAAALAGRRAQALGAHEVGVWLPSVSPRLPLAGSLQALAEGLSHGGYAYTAYRTRASEKPADLDSLIFFAGKGELAEAKSMAASLAALLDGVRAARELANRPGNDLTPRAFAESAQVMARANALQCKVFGPRELEKLGAGAILGVARGSTEEPRMIELTYAPKGRSRGTLVFVGKGITFDSGGISLKPADNMDRMKFDMCGAAAVVGAMQAIAQLKPQVKVVGIVATCENMPGSKAYKPGDVLKAMNGTTIEITNTDAEGRLVLADALSYAQKLQPDAVVDLATLTGAIIIALGTFTAGMYAGDDKLGARLMDSSRRTGERMWPMPMWEDYLDLMKSDVADLKNAAGVREGGACSAAAFLKQFTKYPWAHLDIAGVGHVDRERPGLARGGTGFGVRSLVDLAMRWE